MKAQPTHMLFPEKTLQVSVLVLKRLVIEIMELSPNVCFRYRLMGNMWKRTFVRIVSVTDTRILVNDESENKLISLDLMDIVQFEIDSKFQTFEPHFHYDVIPTAIE